MQEARPDNHAKAVLTHWQERLDKLAGQVEKGDVKPEKLTRTAAGANYALAKYFDERARDEVGKQGKEVQAGYDLQAAADCFEQSLIWTGPASAKGQQQQNEQAQEQAQRANLRHEDVRAIADARLAADRLITAQNLASGQHEGAQTAAAKSGPSNSATAGQNAQAPEPQKAAEELSKAIQSSSEKFKGHAEGQAKAHESPKASASSK
jgi:hypothetical protein